MCAKNCIKTRENCNRLRDSNWPASVGIYWTRSVSEFMNEIIMERISGRVGVLLDEKNKSLRAKIKN